jgi:type IV secretion system protein VirD4
MAKDRTMSVWQIDGGIYFGHQVEESKDEPPTMSRLAAEWNPRAGRFIEYEGDRQILTIGPNGSGKTRKLLVPNLHRLTNWSILCVDPKGELALWTAKHRHDAGSRVVTLDPFGVIERRYPGLVEKYPYLKSAGHNPVAALDPASDDFPDDAKAIGEALIKMEGKDEAYWAKSAQALVAGLVMALSVNKDADPESASLVSLRTLLGKTPETLAKAIKSYVALTAEREPAIGAKLNRFTQISPDNKELFGILSTAVTHTDWLDSRPIRADLSGATGDFGRMKDQPTTVYLVLPPRYLESHATWLRLMITAILTPLIRSTEGRVPVLFMLDEFAQLGHLEVIERNMALARGYGVKLWAVLQDLAQLKDNYERRWESFIANAGIIQSFAPQDVTTREYLSKLSGQRLYFVKSRQESGGQSHGQGLSENRGWSESWSHFQGPAYWEQGLAQLSGEQAVLFPNSRPPRRTWLPDPSEARPDRPQLPEVRSMLDAAQDEARRHEVTG